MTFEEIEKIEKIESFKAKTAIVKNGWFAQLADGPVHSPEWSGRRTKNTSAPKTNSYAFPLKEIETKN